jgi:hypothetical protein
MTTSQRRSRHVLSIAALGLVAATWGCSDASAERAVAALLHCDECRANELSRVVGYGNRAVPSLGFALAGPSDAEWQRANREVTAAWRMMRVEVARSGFNGTLPDSGVAIRRFTSDHFASRHDRAVTALQAIHTGLARAVLWAVVELRDTTGTTGISGAVVRHATAALATF